MKIVHIAPNAPYSEGWGYQENLLTKYQKKLGNDVSLIITTSTNQKERVVDPRECNYISEEGIHVIRLDKKRILTETVTNIFSYLSVYDILVEESPDLIFFHGLLSVSIFDAIKYKCKCNLKCKIIQDNHADYNIGQKSNTVKLKILRQYYRIMNHFSQKHVEKVYGVTPWRKLYAEDYFGINPIKTDVLIMGADDEKIDFKNRESIRKEIRNKFKINKDEFLIVTGGKIDSKKKIDILVNACGGIPGVKLLIFGSVAEQYREYFHKVYNKYDNVIFIGWISADTVYDYFFAADLICFPGQHSVLWEQACASKTPCLFARWPGMEHVNNGGNSDFVDVIDEEHIENKIKELQFTPQYQNMKRIADSNCTDIYLYSNIAIKSLEIVE